MEALLDFASSITNELGAVWSCAQPDVRLRLQASIFPEGVPYTKAGLGTATIGLFFKPFVASKELSKGVVTPTGVEPVFSA